MLLMLAVLWQSFNGARMYMRFCMHSCMHSYMHSYMHKGGASCPDFSLQAYDAPEVWPSVPVR